MTFAKLSATGEDACRAFHEAADNKGGIDPAGAHYPDGSEVGWILVAGYPGRVSSGITAPVTEKTQYFGIEFFLAHSYTPVASSSISPKAFICELICSLVNPPMEMAKVGQWDAQIPHALHEATRVSAFFLLFSSLTIKMA